MLLEAAGIAVTVRPVAVDEAAIKTAMRAEGADAGETAMALADAKAMRVRVPGALVIGADQMLECGGEWFDKPADRNAAREQLRRLRGCRHELLTAISCWRDGEPVWRHLARPALVMRDFSDAFLERYLDAAGDAVLSSVGGYQLEGVGVQLFDGVSGEHAAVLGLPMLPLLGFLRQHGVILA